MSFEHIAPHYDWMERLLAGERLQHMREAWLEKLKGCRRILSVGEGHGRFAAACTARFPEAELTCLDASPRMLAQARQRTLRPGENCRWVEADILEWIQVERYDAIVTCFSLDCFSPGQLAAVVAKLASCATDEACWLVADFAVPADGAARWRAQLVHALMYGFFRIVTGLPARRLTPPDELLRAQGFSLCGRRVTEWGLLQSDWWRRTGR
ncbi:MAG: class I SAM-dependent methyltransferase [Opitutae bacterium]|nr:class I SAM-dependent methyltransferase [Opitutae bacterium]